MLDFVVAGVAAAEENRWTERTYILGTYQCFLFGFFSFSA